MQWKTITLAELEQGEEKLSGPHEGFSPKKLSWLCYCVRCGLVKLKNEPSKRAWKAGCGWKSR